MSTIDNSDVTDTSITYDYLLPGMTYIVEVAALDTNENLLSEWTDTDRYTVSGTIGTVNNIKWSETGNVLTWDQVSDADGYDICVLKEGIQVGGWGYTTNSSIDITTWVDGNSGGNGNYTVMVNAFKHDTGNWLAMGVSGEKYLESKTKVSIGDVSILGTTNVEIASQTVTVEIANDTFQSSLSGSWITNLPAGLSQSVTRDSDTSATITITGTPTAASDASISITIPGEMMTRGVAIEVPINTDAKYEIKDDILITSVSVTGILEPYVGGAPMTYLYGVGYPSDSGYDVNHISWFCDTDGQWITEEAFEEEKSYTMYVYLTLEEGYGFASTVSITINGKTAVFEEPIPDTYRGALKFDSEDVGLAQELTFTDSSEFDIPEGDQEILYTTSRPVLSAVSGGTAPYEISFNPGIAGLFISEGFIKYSRAFVDEERTVEVIVTDSSTPANSKTISIKIGAVFAELVFQDDVGFDIPAGYVNDPITSIDVSAAVSGGKGPYTFSKGSGSPDWLNVSSAGIISGTPTTAIDGETATIVVTDSSTPVKSKSIEIAVGAMVVKDYNISLNKESVTFHEITGYSDTPSQTIVVNNTGNIITGGLTITLTGTGSDKFSITPSTLESLPIGDTADVSISVNTGVGAGTYTATLTIFNSNIEKTVDLELVVSDATLTGITITTGPTKTTYTEGEDFDSTGMVVKATYSDESEHEVTDFTIIGGTDLTTSIESVTVSYTENSVTKTTTQPITVSPVMYEVTFNNNGHGTQVQPQDVYNGNKVVKPADPSETGYTFGGWYKEAGCENAWNFDTDVVTSDVTLYAKWTVNEYTITFDSNGGGDVTSITQDYGTTIVAPADPMRTGYAFSGWLPAVPETMPAEDVTCVAQWVAIDYTVTFDPNGGTVDPTTKTVNYGVEYGELPTPTKAGNNFMGWFTASDDSGVKINSDTVVLSAENHTLYAKWIPISDDDDEGGGVSVGLIVGGVVAVIAAAGVGVFLFLRGRP